MPRVEINKTACTGCGVCVETCPTDVLRLDNVGIAFAAYEGGCQEGGQAGKPVPTQMKAFAAYEEDCQGCFICQWDCAFEAIKVHIRSGSSVSIG